MAAPLSRQPLVPKDIVRMGLPRSVKWVRQQCKTGGIPTLPPHKPPYLIPPNVLFKFGLAEESK